MSVHSISPGYATDVRGWRSWPLSGTFWAGATLVTMWLAVLFVGIFGGDIQISAVDGSHSSWPVVVVVAIAALLATVSIGRRAFRPSQGDEELRGALEDQRRAIAALAAQLDERLPAPH